MSEADILNAFTAVEVIDSDDDDDDIIELVCEPEQPMKPSKKDLALAFSTIEKYSLFVGPNQKDEYLRSMKNLQTAVDSNEHKIQTTIKEFFK